MEPATRATGLRASSETGTDGTSHHCPLRHEGHRRRCKSTPESPLCDHVVEKNEENLTHDWQSNVWPRQTKKLRDAARGFEKSGGKPGYGNEQDLRVSHFGTLGYGPSSDTDEKTPNRMSSVKRVQTRRAQGGCRPSQTCAARQVLYYTPAGRTRRGRRLASTAHSIFVGITVAPTP